MINPRTRENAARELAPLIDRIPASSVMILFIIVHYHGARKGVHCGEQ
jgi:hypothetical protein